jgi:hypothetical protein
MGLPRIGSQTFHIGQDNSSYQQLYGTISSAVYNYIKAQITGTTDYQGEVVYPGDLLPEDLLPFNP